MKKSLYFGTVFLLSLFLMGCSADKANDLAKEGDSAEQAAGSSGAAATGLFGTFETVTLDGEEVTQDIFAEAELTMVNIWGTFCSPCISEMPDLGELADEYAEKGVQIVGIISDVYDAGNEDAKKIVEETGADYTHLVLNGSMTDGYLAGVQVVPTTVFVDREGKKTGEVYTGVRSKKEWSDIIDELLEEK